MNPRIYKEQAKRAVQLLKSYGDKTAYKPGEEGGVNEPPGGWSCLYRPHNRRRLRAWERLSGVPEYVYLWGGWEQEWDDSDARSDWLMRCSYDDMEFDAATGDLLPRRRACRRERGAWISTRAIAPGWKWRGGRAVQVAP